MAIQFTIKLITVWIKCELNLKLKSQPIFIPQKFHTENPAKSHSKNTPKFKNSV